MKLTKLFYHDKPLFGLDIGHDSLKVMQIQKPAGSRATITGYGSSHFASDAIQNGAVAKPEIIADAIHQLIEKSLVGSISSRRVACTLPTARTFSRPMKLPPMDTSAIGEAVRLEAEQYIPVPQTNLYLDYEISRQDDQGLELLLVAVPRNIVDSYMSLLQSLELEPVAFEPSINAASRLLPIESNADPGPAILVDIGTITTDIALFDKTLLVASTVNTGGNTLTDLIAKKLRLSPERAEQIKNQDGIAFSEKQQRILEAVKPALESLSREIQKSIRYYSERAGKTGKLSQIITVGGGALMPGLNQYLSKELRLPTRTLDPWQKISFGKLPRPEPADLPMYLTVAGEAILDPLEVTK